MIDKINVNDKETIPSLESGDVIMIGTENKKTKEPWPDHSDCNNPEWQIKANLAVDKAIWFEGDASNRALPGF